MTITWEHKEVKVPAGAVWPLLVCLQQAVNLCAQALHRVTISTGHKQANGAVHFCPFIMQLQSEGVRQSCRAKLHGVQNELISRMSCNAQLTHADVKLMCVDQSSRTGKLQTCSHRGVQYSNEANVCTSKNV